MGKYFDSYLLGIKKEYEILKEYEEQFSIDKIYINLIQEKDYNKKKNILKDYIDKLNNSVKIDNKSYLLLIALNYLNIILYLIEFSQILQDLYNDFKIELENLINEYIDLYDFSGSEFIFTNDNKFVIETLTKLLEIENKILIKTSNDVYKILEIRTNYKYNLLGIKAKINNIEKITKKYNQYLNQNDIEIERLQNLIKLEQERNNKKSEYKPEKKKWSKSKKEFIEYIKPIIEKEYKKFSSYDKCFENYYNKYEFDNWSLNKALNYYYKFKNT